MRFTRLSLERYGRFEGSELAFRPGKPDLHVIYGANEAGKTTCLSAISDLLFGFQGRSPYNFRFEYPLLRIGAAIEEDGRSLSFRRRKSNSGTLIDSADRPIDEAILQRLLKGQSRESFRTAFSLDQAGLRRGGRSMVEAKDDLGHTLFAAGSGLTGVTAELAKLESEADAIWGPRAKASRTYTTAERKLAESLKLIRDQALKPKAWTDARITLESCERVLKELEEQRRAVSEHRRKGERVRRIAADVQLRSDLLAKLSAHAGTISLTPSREESAILAVKAAEEADQARIAAEARRSEVEEQLQNLQADEEVLTEAEKIEQLIESRGAASKAGQDLARLRTELAVAVAAINRLRNELGELSAAPPTRLAVAQLRELAKEHAKIQSALRELEQGEADLVFREKRLTAQLADAELSQTLPELAAAVEAGRRLGDDVDDRCFAASRRVTEAETNLQTALARLAPWIGSIEALQSLPGVGDGEIEAARYQSTETEAEARRERAAATRFAEDAALLELQIDALTGEGAAVPAELLVEARLARSQAWSELRQHILDGVRLVDPTNQVSRYEDTVENADLLSDRRYALAEASGRLASLSQRYAETLLASDQASQRADAATKLLNDLTEGWALRLHKVGMPEFPPSRLQAWLTDRAQALKAWDDLRDLRELAAVEEHRRASVIAMIKPHLSPAETKDQGATLAPILRAAESLLQAEETRAAAIKADQAELRQNQDALATTRRRKVSLSSDLQKITDEWRQATEGNQLTLALEGADQRLALFDELRQLLDDEADLGRRILGIERDADQFEQEVHALANHLNTPSAADAAPRLDLLRARLLTGRQVEALIAKSREERDRRQQEVTHALTKLELAKSSLQPIMEETQSADADALLTAIEGSRTLRTLRETLTQTETRILAGGDGYPLAELVTAVQAEDPDTLAQRANALEQELADLDEAVSKAAQSRGDAGRAFAAMDNLSHGAVDAAADAAQARAEMAVQAEAYILKRSQIMTLRWAIDQYQDRNQAPLLVRASELFSILTLGRYQELQIERDGPSPRLLALHDEGRAVVDVDGMSEGTTDQLFLALRLAAVEQSIASGVTLPFLADDLFVNFDDQRAEAGFRVLSELAQSTQVLFFTHHAHLAVLAKSVVGAEQYSECALG